jgi:ribonuclease-3
MSERPELAGDWEILDVALTHRSFLNESGAKGSYDALAQLGSKVEIAIRGRVAILEDPEIRARGRLAQVFGRKISVAASEYYRLSGLEHYLKTGRQLEEATPAMKADICQALVAAVYLSRGLERAEAVVRAFWDSPGGVVGFSDDRGFSDAITELQELVQGPLRGKGKIEYEYVSERDLPGNRKEFECVCIVNGIQFERGIGNSKKEARQAAARATLTSQKFADQRRKWTTDDQVIPRS